MKFVNGLVVNEANVLHFANLCQKAVRNSLNHYRLKQSKVLTLKQGGIQYSTSVQFCPGYYSSEVFDLLSHARSLTAKIIPRAEIWQKSLSIDRATKH